MEDNRNKILFGSILLVVLAAVIYLALQTPEQTMTLSETVRAWISKLGYSRGPSEIRSDIHLAEYFVVGMSAILFFRAMNWKPWAGALAASAFGLLKP